MNIYYTAKDIEELVGKGIYVLELGPNTSLTDFARETAEQLDVTLIDAGQAPELPVQQAASTPVARQQAVAFSSPYNKPRGCQVDSRPGTSSGPTPAAAPSGQTGSTPVNRLVDLMGRIINRGD